MTLNVALHLPRTKWQVVLDCRLIPAGAWARGNQADIAFANEIVQKTNWAYVDEKGYLAFQMIDNTHDGYYFTKGKAIHIRWEKTSDYEPTRYYDDNGN